MILTASLSEPEPKLYMSLASLIKQLAIETCWIKTPRSTHVIQALIILSIWPLPNEKFWMIALIDLLDWQRTCHYN